jgi:uncharacterized protein (TIGR00369 family)
VIKGIQTMDTSSDIRQRWLDEERSVRSRMAEVGVVSPDQLKSFGGLEFLEQALQGSVPPPPIAQTLRFVLISVARGEAVFQGTPGFEHYNPLGIVHGGYCFTLLDSAAGCAVHTTLPAGTGYTTLELKINFIRALTTTTGPVRALGKVIHSGKSTAVAEGRIEDPDGKLYALCTTTCLLFPMRGASP